MRAKYATKPFQLWQKAKEMRLQNYRNIMHAKEEGRLLFTGQRGAPTEILAGFGDFEFLGMNDYAASVAYDRPMALESFETIEAKGYARDLCAYWRCYMGSLLTRRFYFGGPFPSIDIVFTQNACDTNGKCQKLIAEQLGIPCIMVDIPVIGDHSKRLAAHYVDYVTVQFNEAIERICRVSGRMYDDEKLIQAIYNRCRSEVLWSQIMMLNQTIPAVMDMKSQYSMFVPLVMARHKEETVKFYEALKEEVEERVARGIAAVGEERCRLLHYGAPPWHSLRLFRLPQAYGAVFIGSQFSMMSFGAFEIKPDGRLGPKLTPQEQGVDLKNRDAALRFFAAWYLDRAASGWCGTQPRIDSQVHLVKEWHGDAVVFHLDRGCENNTSGLLETKVAVAESTGVPTMVYEGNRGDSRDWSEAETMDRLEAFLESLGLKKLED